MSSPHRNSIIVTITRETEKKIQEVAGNEFFPEDLAELCLEALFPASMAREVLWKRLEELITSRQLYLYQRVPVKVAFPREYYRVIQERFVETEVIKKAIAMNIERILEERSGESIDLLNLDLVALDSYLPYVFQDYGPISAGAGEVHVEILLKRDIYNRICESLGEDLQTNSISDYILELLTEVEEG